MIRAHSVKQRKRNFLVLLLVITICVSVVSPKLGYATDTIFSHTLSAVEGSKQRIEVTISNETVQCMELYNHDEVLIDTKNVVANVMEFEVNGNDTYTIKALDSSGVVLNQQEVKIDALPILQVTNDELTMQFSNPHVLATEIRIKNNGNIVANIQIGDTLEYKSENNKTYSIEELDAKKHILSSQRYQIAVENQKAMIQSFDDLIAIENGVEYTMANDIVVDDQWQESVETILDNRRDIILHGQGYTIKNVRRTLFNKLENSTLENVYLQGEIKNKSTEYAGTFANEVVNSTITGNGFNGRIEATNAVFIGGLFGKQTSGLLENSFTSLYIIGNQEAAGVVGYSNGNIRNVYSSGVISGKNSSGLVSKLDGRIENAYSQASTIGDRTSIIGTMDHGQSSHVVYDKTKGTKETIPNINGLTTSEMLSGRKVVEGQWVFEKGKYPQLSSTVTSVQKQTAQRMQRMSVEELIETKDQDTLDIVGNVQLQEELNGEEIKWKMDERSIDQEEVEAKESGALLVAQVGEIQSTYYVKGKMAEVKNAVITPGLSSIDEKTVFSFEADNGYYYLAVKAGQTMPNSPITAEEAKQVGWQRKAGVLGQSGTMTLINIDWDTNYDVYVISALAGSVQMLGTQKTNKGITNGIIELTGEWLVGDTITANLKEANIDEAKGSWVFETASTINATVWNNVSDAKQYTLVQNDLGKYIRVRFVPESTASRTGNIVSQVTTQSYVKQALETVKITGSTMINEKLQADVYPNEADQEVEYLWYIENQEAPIYNGKEYTIDKQSVGKKVYVKAIPKKTGKYAKEVSSELTEIIQTKAHPTPDFSMVLSNDGKDNSTISIELPLIMQNNRKLYRVGYKEVGESEYIEAASTISGTSKTVLTRLKANTEYAITVKQVESEGYLDSLWSSGLALVVKTDKASVTGEIIVQGKPKYNEKLEASVEGTQTGDFYWYREGESIAIASKKNSYTLVKEDIGKRIRVEFVGNGEYSGKLIKTSDSIEKIEQNRPTEVVTIDKVVDTSIEVTLPIEYNSGEYQLGYKKVDEKAITNYQGSYTAGSKVTIIGLERETEYEVYVKYSATEIYNETEYAATCTVGKTTKTSISKEAMTLDRQPMQGEVLRADVKEGISGFWTWKKTYNGVDTIITNFYPTEDKNGSYYTVPMEEPEGTVYTITFEGSEGYEGQITKQSQAVVKAIGKVKYPTPSAPMLQGNSDTTMTIKISEGLEGNYQFAYGTTDTIDESTVIGETILSAGGQITFAKLNRDTTYYVRVRRVAGAGTNFETSDWSSTSLKVKTNKTTIIGNVVVGPEYRVDSKLTLTYYRATYIPTGDDCLDATWDIYRVKEGIETFVVNISSSTDGKAIYKITSADIGYKIKAVYNGSGSHGFTGTKEAITSETMDAKKEADPTGIKWEKGNTYTDKNEMKLSSSDIDIYYQVRKSSDPIPTIPKNSVEALQQKWKLKSTTEVVVTQDYQDEEILPKEKYVVYVVRVGTTSSVSSGRIAEETETGMRTQDGTINFIQQANVGKVIKAQLQNQNNNKGNWKWYVSNSGYDGKTIVSMPPVSDTDAWNEITTGFTPIANEEYSELNVTEELFGHYIKAEFMADETKGYSGTIKSSEERLVRKIYNETLTLTSSTQDGNKKPKAYSNSVITGTINNYIETGNISRDTVQFKVAESIITSEITYKDNTFSYTMPNDENYDGKEITAEISKPKILELYVDKDLNVLTEGIIESKTSTNTSFTYSYGIPISNADDMEKFMKQESPYTDRSATSKYVLSSNINMSSKETAIAYSEGQFAGMFDGDFHTVTSTKNPVFANIAGTVDKPAIIKNIIFNKADINTTSLEGKIASGAILSKNLTYAEVSKVLAVNGIVQSNWDAALLVGRADKNGVFLESGTAGGYVAPKETGTSSGGFLGYADRNGVITDCFSINTSHPASAEHPRAGFVGGGHGVTITNSYSAAVLPFTSAYAGGLASNLNGYVAAIIKNGFYDSTVAPNTNLAGAKKGIAKTTDELTGGVDSAGKTLQEYFDSSGSEGKWTYKKGFYPRLTWNKNHPIANLYSATRGAFISIDGETTYDAMFNGEISGSIQVPTELQGKDYSIMSSDSSVLKVSDSGTIVPVGTVGQTATISVTYTEPDETIGGTASNIYQFTIASTVNDMGEVSIVDEGGFALTTNPISNQKIVVNAPNAKTYQWYRRLKGTTNATAIVGATYKEYTIKAADMGYELAVLVNAPGYASTYSKYTSDVINVAPTSPPQLSNVSDSGFTITGVGGVTDDYEYAYAVTLTGEKIMIEEVGKTILLNNLKRNTNYYVWSRITGGEGYDASPWSAAGQIRTLKTALNGDLSINNAIHVGTQVVVDAPATNAQKGEWIWKRIKDGTTTTITSGITSQPYQTMYTLTANDIDAKIQIDFNAVADFSGTLSIATDGVVRRVKPVSGPTKVLLTSKTDTSITIHSGDTSATEYEYGYTMTEGKLPTEAVGSNNQDAPFTISNLQRNSKYYIYARYKETLASESSDWSTALEVTTDKTEVVGSVVFNASNTVNQVLSASVENSNGQKGTWLWERIDLYDIEVRATLSDFQVEEGALASHYVLKPEDAGYRIRATFNGEGDFKGMLSTTKEEIQKDTYKAPDTFTLEKKSDHSLSVKVPEGYEGNYQFAYSTSRDGVKEVVNAGVVGGNTLVISDLSRNTTYYLFMRRMESMGYKESIYSSTVLEVKTDKTTLTGNVSLTGTQVIGQTLQATYESGRYEFPGDDQLGTWVWYRNEQVIAGQSTSSYTIQKEDGGRVVRVEYIAGGDFTGSRSRSTKTIYKNTHGAPSVPIIESKEADTLKGSSLIVKNSQATLYYKAALITATIPTPPMMGKEIEAGWLQGTGSDLEIAGLEENELYKVYAVVGEDLENNVSLPTASATIKTAKTILTGAIETQAIMPIGKEMTYSISNLGVAPQGTWSFYASDSSTALNNQWEYLGSGEEVIQGNQNTVQFIIPLKHAGRHIFIVFEGYGKYQGVVSTSALAGGKPMVGTIQFSTDTPQILTPIEALYSGSDEANGGWIWYRNNTEIPNDQNVYTAAGLSSIYIPTHEDAGKTLTAKYVAMDPRFSGEVENTTVNRVIKARQNTPSAPTIVGVVGNSIELSNGLEYGKIQEAPKVIYGVKEVSKTDIEWQTQESPWVTDLKPFTEYVAYVKYLETSTYQESAISSASIQTKTAKILLPENSVSIESQKRIIVGQTITAKYSGEAYSGGTWTIRNDTRIILENVVGTETLNQSSISYIPKLDDINSYVSFIYTPPVDSKYEGSATKRTVTRVMKDKNPSMPVAPKVQQGADTNLFLEVEDSGLEYAITESENQEPMVDSTLWKSYPVGTYEYMNLKRETSYDIYVRYAETEDYSPSDGSKTTMKTLKYIDMQTMVLKNEDQDVPMGSVAVEIPNSLQKGQLKIKNVVMKYGEEVVNGNEGYLRYVDELGNIKAEVYERGSQWANQNFGHRVAAMQGGTIVDSASGIGEFLDSSGASEIRVELYRSNAVTRAGRYSCQIMIEDSRGAESLLHIEVDMQTQIKATMPINISMQAKEGYIQLTNNQSQLSNAQGMPVTIKISDKPEIGSGMPSFAGKLIAGIAGVKVNDMYLKMGVDESHVDNQAGVWFQSSDAENYQALVSLGAFGKRNYQVYGIYGKGVNFPFTEENDRIIQKAYQFYFQYEVSKEDRRIYTSTP